MNAAPAHIVGLAIEHRTSEDWLLHLPMRMGPSEPLITEATTAAALVGATCQLRLMGKLTTTEASTLLFQGGMCRIEGHEIVTEAPSSFFEGKAGNYSGELLVRLGNGFDFVSHVVELELIAGLGWVA